MRPTILTIDDAKAVRLLVEEALGSFDCDVHEAANGFNGFFAIERARPDLILLDIAMPVMDGLEMLERLKGTPQIADIPVIMLPSRADHAVIPSLTTRGACGVLLKPFTKEALVAAIQQVVKLPPARQ